jgi:hypothetical protein
LFRHRHHFDGLLAEFAHDSEQVTKEKPRAEHFTGSGENKRHPIAPDIETPYQSRSDGHDLHVQQSVASDVEADMHEFGMPRSPSHAMQLPASL